MKLRNKKTGEITEANDWNMMQEYRTLAELNEEWEDYEELNKHYWVIGEDGILLCRTVGYYSDEERCKQIGNYFDTREEAEQAVKKLKAWKRLKDKGFEFTGYDLAVRDNGTLCGQVFFETYNTPIEGVDDDMAPLFGGEE